MAGPYPLSPELLGSRTWLGLWDPECPLNERAKSEEAHAGRPTGPSVCPRTSWSTTRGACHAFLCVRLQQGNREQLSVESAHPWWTHSEHLGPFHPREVSNTVVSSTTQVSAASRQGSHMGTKGTWHTTGPPAPHLPSTPGFRTSPPSASAEPVETEVTAAPPAPPLPAPGKYLRTTGQGSSAWVTAPGTGGAHRLQVTSGIPSALAPRLRLPETQLHLHPVLGRRGLTPGAASLSLRARLGESRPGVRLLGWRPH